MRRSLGFLALIPRSLQCNAVPNRLSSGCVFSSVCVFSIADHCAGPVRFNGAGIMDSSASAATTAARSPAVVGGPRSPRQSSPQPSCRVM